MFLNRRQYYQGYPYIPTYSQAQIQQYKQHALASHAKLQAYRDIILQEVRSQNRVNPPVSLLRSTLVNSACPTPVNDNDFTPVGHVSRPGSTPTSYRLWSSSSSTSESDYSYRKIFSRNLCRVITICSILLFILGVFGIIGIAVYFGYASDFTEGESTYLDSYVGKLTILRGDSWVPELAIPISPSFKAKSNKYKNMLNSVYEVSVLGIAFRNADVNSFNEAPDRKSGFEFSFSITLDRRKIPWRLPNTEKVVEDILLQEIGSLSPVAFYNVKVDRNAIYLEKKKSPSDTVTQTSATQIFDIPAVEMVPIITGAGTILKKKIINRKLKTQKDVITKTSIYEAKSPFVIGNIISPTAITTISPTSLISTTSSPTTYSVTQVSPATILMLTISPTLSSTTSSNVISSPSTTVRKPENDLQINRDDDRRNSFKKQQTSSIVTSSLPTETIIEPNYRGKPWNFFEELTKITDTSFKPPSHTTNTKEGGDNWNPLKILNASFLTTIRPSTINEPVYEKDHWYPLQSQKIRTESPYFKGSDTTVPANTLTLSNENDKILSPKFGAMTIIEAPNNFVSMTVDGINKDSTVLNVAKSQNKLLNTFRLSDSINEFKINKNNFHVNNNKSKVSLFNSEQFVENYPIRRTDTVFRNDGKHEFVVNYPNDALSHLKLANKKKDPPTKNDIRSILENLLFYTPNYDNSSSFWHNLRRIFKVENETKTEQVTKDLINFSSVSDAPNTKSILHTTEKTQNKPFRYILQAKDFRESNTPSTRKQLPLDKFRNKAQKSNNNLTMESHKNRYKLWSFLTTHKPLILDTEVVTSKSSNVEYGTLKNLKPIYFPTGTDLPEQNVIAPETLNNFRFQFDIPQIDKPNFWKNKGHSIKVNRTIENYPKVVIVNLPKFENEEGRFLKKNSFKISEFLNSINTKFSQFNDENYNRKWSNQNSTLFLLANMESSTKKLLNGTAHGVIKVPDKNKTFEDYSMNLFNYTANEKSNMPNLTLGIINDTNRTGKEIKHKSTKLHKNNSTDSPIHIFYFKEDQTLEELLTEIFKNVPNKDEVLDSNLEKKHALKINFNKAVGQIDNTAIPPGKDYLLFIQALSNILSGSSNNFNMVFENQYNEIKSEKYNKAPKEELKLGNFSSNSTKDIDNKIKTSSIYKHNYKHELFPILTRPFNYVKRTTPTVLLNLDKDDTENSTALPVTTVPNKIVTSYDVSYSIHSQLNNSSIPFLSASGFKGDCNSEQFKCGNGQCIALDLRCNMKIDCNDNSDEFSCTCADSLKTEGYTRKICDGIIDCLDESDENNCEWCSPDKFICSGEKKCIDKEKVCDAISDCSNGDDEKDCVKIAPTERSLGSLRYYDEGYLMVRREGVWGKFCIENFENTIIKAGISWKVKDLGEAVCHTLTYDSISFIEKEKDKLIMGHDVMPFYEMNISLDTNSPPRSSRGNVLHRKLKRSYPAKELSISRGFSELRRHIINGHNSWDGRRLKRQTTGSHLGLKFQEASCSSRDILKIKCQSLQCGIRPRAVTQQSRIVGGTNSSSGAWPWHAALYKEGEYQCGATIISEHWLISAGHCFYKVNDQYWVVRMGALRLGTKFPSPYEQVRTVSHVFIHPDYVHQGYINDISMVKVEKAIDFNDYIRPVCLPAPGTDVSDGQRCTLVGWGQLFEVKNVFPDTLQEVEVPLISTNECRIRTVFLPLYRITEDMFCAGYDRGGRDACLGDSGGPLMCQKLNGHWEVVGITSNGYGCARPHHPGVYTKLPNYLPWIVQTMALGNNYRVFPIKTQCNGIRCQLGKCLPRSSICNGTWECSNGVDERNCNH